MKVFSRAGVTDIVAAFSVFFLISIPSLKLIYSSSIINIVPVFGMLVSIFLKGFIADLGYKKILLMSWACFSVVLMISFFWNFSKLDIKSFNFIYVIIVVFLSIIVLNEKVVYYTSVYLIFWCAFVALWQLLVGIPYKAELGQTYLTVAMPLGALFTMTLFGVTSSLSKRFRMCSFLLSLITVSALGTLLSRGAVLLPVLIFFVHLIITVCYSKSVGKKIIVATLIVILFGFCIWSFNNLDFRQLYRFEMLFNNLDDEPRVVVYARAISLILDSPIIGYGVGSAAGYFNGTYPHNIFLDVLINGGALLFVPFFVVICVYFYMVMQYYKFSSNYRPSLSLLTMFAFSAYYLFQWNISWGLDTAYIPLVTLFYFIFFMQKVRCLKGHVV